MDENLLTLWKISELLFFDILAPTASNTTEDLNSEGLSRSRKMSDEILMEEIMPNEEVKKVV